MLSKRLKMIAHPKLDIEKPENIPLIHQMRRPFITKMNNPNVTIVTGMVRKMRIGFRIALKIVSTTATGIALTKLSISAPGKIRAVIHIETDKTIKRRRYDILFRFLIHLLI